MSSSYDINRLVDGLRSVAQQQLSQESGLTRVSSKAESSHEPRLALKDITAVISIAGNANVLVAFSFDMSVLRCITRSFLDVKEAQLHEDDCIDMACEFINIVVGLATTDVGQEEGHSILFSPPILIYKAEAIRHHKRSRFFATQISTESGGLDIHCIAPLDSLE